MMAWVFAGITLAAALMATFLFSMKRAILSLWVAGLGVGAVYLTVGAEFLAIIQWIVSTLVTISFIFFSVMFGEYRTSETRNARSEILPVVLSLILGGGFAFVIWLGTRELPESVLGSFTGNDLGDLGRLLTQDNLLSLEVLAQTLFLVLVGGGVVARLERSDHSK